MIIHYGFSIIGHYHKKNNIPLQDFHCLKVIDNHFSIASVADGLGSEKHSDIASKIASTKSVLYCYKNIKRGMGSDDIIRILKDAFNYSLLCINNYVESNKDDICEYDTTLSLAVFLDGTVYYGHSGDSGIIVYCEDGTYQSLTTKQNDSNGYVYPLCCGLEKWEFGFKKFVSGVLLATDGILNLFYPYLLRNNKNNLYVALLEYFMNKKKLLKLSTYKSKKKIYNFINKIDEQKLSDDKTIVVIIDTTIKSDRQSDCYYSVPDWEKLKKEYDKEYFKIAYPHLVGKIEKE